MVSSGIFGGDVFPPGFRFHPTDEELVLYYLKRKICGKRNHLDVIGVTDVYKWDPEDLPRMSKLKTGDRIWFFFTPRDRKHPNGSRYNRATGRGYWKVTGKDRVIECSTRAVGLKKTLVFYRGRAPSGERTDWVMHEYTMDEVELKRCETGKQYYALYKVYKKSGAGPKNGEQYGAVFVEEDWDELEGNMVNTVNESARTNDNIGTVNTLCQSSLDKLEEILNEIPVEPIPFQIALDNWYAPDQLADKDETHGPSVEHSYVNATIPVLQEFVQPPDVINQTTQSQFGKPPEVSSVPINDAKGPVFTELDFIEMDDLIGPDTTTEIVNTSVNCMENMLLSEFDGLTEFDLFQDAPSLFCDMGHVESTQISELHMNAFDNGVTVAGPSSCPNNLEGYPLQQHFDNYDGVNYQQWIDEQSCSVVTNTEPDLSFAPPSVSGGPHENQNQDHGFAAKQDGSWLSSTLWSMVESIPTKPASASEHPLMNKAFERISSFSRVRANVENINASASSRNAGKSRIGLICFSLVGVLCAVVWMLNS